jgi:uncharacterized protein (DUF1778 family)
MAEPKTARLNLRVARHDDSLFREAAALAEESVSEFLVESGRERAERLLADRIDFAVDEGSWDAFTAALDRPAEVRPELVELFLRPRPR